MPSISPRRLISAASVLPGAFQLWRLYPSASTHQQTRHQQARTATAFSLCEHVCDTLTA